MKIGFGARMIEFAGARPRLISWTMGLVTALLVVLAVLPTLWPAQFPLLNAVTVDTDPENMLPHDEPVRVFNDAMKKEFSLNDIVVVGIANDTDPDGVFNPATLKRVYDLTEFARGLKWPDPENPKKQVGVVEADILAPSMVDDIRQAGLGAVSFGWLMPEPPKTRKEALAVRERAMRIPMFNDTLVSGDGKMLAIYLPLTSKDLSYRVRKALLEKTASWKGTGDQIYITGLPIAEDTFGVEMFIQMAISAPLAMVVIFLIMWLFFRNLTLIISPMIVAMVASIATMALLVISGNTIHIMSSMIPIFVMPIAVLDAVHILSEFFDRYQETKDRWLTVRKVMHELFMPMLFTSLTTMVGFASLALTPIPPVQVFGIFISIGVFIAWILTILFVPAYIMMMPEKKLENFGHLPTDTDDPDTMMSRGLKRLGRAMYCHARLVMLGVAAVVALGGYGISRININDNPIKWFEESHPIRIADKVLNQHFGGTYMAYLALMPGDDGQGLDSYLKDFAARLKKAEKNAADEGIENAGKVFSVLGAKAREVAATAGDEAALLKVLNAFVEEKADTAPDEEYDAWDAAQYFIGTELQRKQVFKQPEVLRYIEGLQQALLATGHVGKANTLSDVVKTVHRELLLGKAEEFRIPDSAAAVAQTLLTYQNSHRPDDLWHFVTPDYRKSNIWVQLKSGDNKDMSQVVAAIEDYTAKNPPPEGIRLRWYGLNYINVVWQERMVSGMMQSLAGSFIIVLLMMAGLFRSVTWGLLSMIPLSVTIGLIYGVIGLIGKDYDMPIAVLSALSLGLAVDYAIHFIARSRAITEELGDWHLAVDKVFGEPARAITRNALVLGVGFTPLLLAPLVPYQTVGIFIAAILLAAGAATLMILPAAITLLKKFLFPKPEEATDPACIGD